jgi:uncharacterized protein involved in type VI secretion and phage assembly
MGLYDIIDEIAEKQVTKSETGDERIHGAMVGVVTKNADPTGKFKGRICVNIPTRDSEINELKWVRMAQPSSGGDYGHYFIPEIGDQVLLVFEGGNIEKPFCVGCVSKDMDKHLMTNYDLLNGKKRIMTKNGSEIRFDDRPGEGVADAITITTATGAHEFTMDNQGFEISLKDKGGQNQIKMSTTEAMGKIDIKTETKLTIRVGDTIKIKLDGQTGKVQIDCTTLKVKSTGNVTVKSDAGIKQDGATITQNASSMFKLASNGMVSINGSAVKVG